MSTSVWIGVAVFAIGTYGLRFAGVRLMHRAGGAAPGSDTRARLLTATVAALLVAVVVGSAVVDEHGFTGIDRIAGVAVGGLLALRRAPLVVTLIAAAATTALMRLAL